MVRCPPQSFFLVSAVFHYLGPSFAVLLFTRVDVLGVTWLRIAGAGAVFALWRRPWRLLVALDTPARLSLMRFGVVLAGMNSLFYLAIDRLPLSTVGAIEFLGVVGLAALGARTGRNAAALVLTTAGVATLADVRLVAEPLGFGLALANCALFVVYVILGHRIANNGIDRPAAGRPAGGPMNGIDQLAAAMLVAAVVVTPIGLVAALPAFTHPGLLLAGLGVAVCSSVIPYVADQMAMARLALGSVALMLALLPMFATVIGAVVLHQIPTGQDMVGVALVASGVALHRAQPPKQHAAVSG
ncbi:MAG: EamA family transporter [Acidimicrobiales bacterium]